MVHQIETDYLVVGAGASGMAFVDALIAETDAEVVMVDRRHRPGGHWVDAYPFVRLHQPSTCYGVNSRVLGGDCIDETGPNAGFYERATAAEICDYYTRVLEEHMLPSGQVRFYGMSDYVGNGAGGYRFVSNLTGEATTVKVRRKLVDTTYTEGTIPATHTPAFEVDAGVRLLPPNDLVHLSDGAAGYTVIGAGKTAMDACCWLMDNGVDPGDIRWIRPRDPWTFNRAAMQPLELVGSYMGFYSRMVEAMAEASSTADAMHRLEGHGIVRRIDTSVEPAVLRGATLDDAELAALRRIENVVRLGKVRRVGTDRVTLDEGTIPSGAGQVYVDCTASALGAYASVPVRPIFEAGRITAQIVTLGIIPWSAATLGYVEATRDDDDEKNRLCPPLEYFGEVADPPRAFDVVLRSASARMAEPDIAAWNEGCRLNPARGVADHLDDTRVTAGFARLAENMGPALANLEQLVAQATSPASV